MKDNDNKLLHQLQFIAGMTPNNQELGEKFRALLNLPENNPERMSELDDEECISCGS